MGASQSASAQGGASSSSRRPTTDDGIDEQDYYALLELPTDDPGSVSSDDVRRAYRRLALRYHPDKNPDDVERANRRFGLVSQAYEVLSDDQERAWYDAHRDAILAGHADADADGGADGGVDLERGFDEAEFQAFRSGKAQPSPARGNSSAGLTVRQLMRFLDPSLASDAHLGAAADETGFFGVYRRLFERLAQEEALASPYPGEDNGPVPSLQDDLPSFGSSDTPYLADRFATGGANSRRDGPATRPAQVRDFYAAWSGFATRKGFAWKDGYRTADAPDRRVKRLMDKENKRMRDAARREYNDMVRSIVAFLRKRDPRVKAHLAATFASTSNLSGGGPNGFATHRQRAGASPSAARRAGEVEEELKRRRREEQLRQAAAYRAQSWNTPDEGANAEVGLTSDERSDTDEEEADEIGDGDEDGDAGRDGRGGMAADDTGEQQSETADVQDEGDDDDDDEDEGEGESVWDCVACDKRFRTEAAWRNHERSKKHRQQVWRLKKEMLNEERQMQRAAAAAAAAASDGDPAADAAARDGVRAAGAAALEGGVAGVRLDGGESEPRDGAGLARGTPSVSAAAAGDGGATTEAAFAAGMRVPRSGTGPGRTASAAPQPPPPPIPPLSPSGGGGRGKRAKQKLKKQRRRLAETFVDGQGDDDEEDEEEQEEGGGQEGMVRAGDADGDGDGDAGVGADVNGDAAKDDVTRRRRRRDGGGGEEQDASEGEDPRGEDRRAKGRTGADRAEDHDDESPRPPPPPSSATPDSETRAAAPAGPTPLKPPRRRAKADAAGGAKAKERCNVCAQRFPSRSKLFAHVRESGHARAVVEEGDGGGGGEEDVRGGRKVRGGKAGRKR